MRILITGADGQLGQSLQEALSGHSLTPIDLPDVDVTDARSIATAVGDAQAQLVIHCAAYTDVDGCTRDPQLAHRVNALGSLNTALACQAVEAAMQLRGIAGENQVDGAKVALIQALGGPASTAATHVLEALE